MRHALWTYAVRRRRLLLAGGSILFLAAALLATTAFAGSARARQQAGDSVSAAAFPFYDGFESGTLGSDWAPSTASQGRVQVGSSYAYAGAYSLLLDDAVNDSTYSTAAAILTVNLSGQTQAELDFWWREFADENHAPDGVFISADNGANWYALFSFNDGPEFWRHQVLDLDAAAATHGLTLNDHFQIKFQFYDASPIPTDGYAIDEVHVRPNAAPVLAWPGNPDYQQDGLHPETGDVGDSYVYRIAYADMDGDPPVNVGVHIRKGGVDIAGSPFSMTCPAGDYSVGVVCSYTKIGLEAGKDYTYTFVAEDDQDNAAAPTPAIDAPDVIRITRVRIPVVMRDAGPPEGPPILNAIDNPGGDYEYTVSWSAVVRATRYTLEEDDNAAFSSPATVSAGSGTSKAISASAVGTYYYRVKASNALGESGWSNIQSVVVTVPPPPCPQAGTWSGHTDEAQSISYTVADTPTCRVTSLKITSRVECIYPRWSFLYTVEYFTAQPIAGGEFEYYYNYNPNNHVERVSGTFDSQTQAHGDAYFMIPNPSNPASYCISLPDWTASHAR
jgi:hypothetical protein